LRGCAAPRGLLFALAAIIMGILLRFRRTAEERLRRQRDFSRAIDESLGEGLYALDTAGRLTYMNPAAERLLGWTQAELLGRVMHDVIHFQRPDGSPYPRAECAGLIEVLRSGVTYRNDDDVFTRKDGTMLSVAYSSAPIRGHGRSVGLVVAFRDITERKRMEDELRWLNAALDSQVRERTRQLEEANRELEAFAFSVSHDLRAPLRAVQGLAQALLDDYAAGLPPAGRDYARRIVAAGVRMDTLIRELLVYSHLSRAEIALRPVDLDRVAEEALDEMAEELRERQARVAVAAGMPRALGHPAVLPQVIGNLLSNAVKFVAPGTRPRVEVWAEERGENVRLWVADNGIGIAPADQERIFAVFERLHGVEAYPGTGVGLGIVRKGAERMGGRAGVESRPGEGSRFWIELRKAEQHPASRPDESQQPACPAEN
jgi:PAS domain S-box-containing protein